MKEFSKKYIMSIVREQEEEEEEPKKKVGNSDFSEMISKLNTSAIQIHIFHWQTKGTGSFAQHKAFGDYYDKIPDLIDGLVESYQGKYGIITNFTCDGVEQYKGKEQSIKYFQELAKMVDSKRNSVKDSWIQNQIDNVVELIYSTLYKLKNLE